MSMISKQNDENIQRMMVTHKIAGILAAMEDAGSNDMGWLNSRQATKFHMATKLMKNLVDELMRKMPC